MAFKYKGLRLKDPSLMKRLRRVPNIKFTRASVAYDKYGNSVPVDTPRFGIAGGPNDGVLIEEAHTNLLTANQSTGTDTLGDTTGFEGVRKSETITSSTEQSHTGTKSLKCVTPGLLTQEGIITSPISGLSKGVVYIFSAWVYAPNGADMYWFMGDGGDNNVIQPFTGTGAWQRVEYPFTPDGSPNHYVSIRTNAKQAITFYVDTLQLTAGYPLSWTLGGTTMAAETLTVNSSVYDLTSGTIELEALANDIIKTDGINNYLLSTADGDGNNQISLLDDSSNNLTITTKASDAATSVSYADSNLTSNTMFKVAAPYKSDKLKLFKDGTSVGTPLTSANLPTTKQTIYLGSKYDGTLQANTLIRNVVLTKQDRVDGEITNRSYRDGFGVDKEVTLIAPLKNNLNAYRVATV